MGLPVVADFRPGTRISVEWNRYQAGLAPHTGRRRLGELPTGFFVIKNAGELQPAERNKTMVIVPVGPT
jgi:hypothetical protein